MKAIAVENEFQGVGDDLLIIDNQNTERVGNRGTHRSRGKATDMRIFEYNDYMPDSLRQFKAEIFQALAHPTRIAILDLLRTGELTVSSFVERLELEQANLSQHLAVLRARQIVVTRKAGNQVFYSVRDPLIWKMLDMMKRYFQKQVGESMALLEEEEKAEVRR